MRARGLLGRVDPFTRCGRATLALTVGSYAGAVLLGWIELAVLAATSFMALLAGVPFIVGRYGMEIQRSVAPTKAMVGDRVEAVLTVSSPGHRVGGHRIGSHRIGSLGLMIDDHVDGKRVELRSPSPVATAEPDSSRSFQLRHVLPTDRRGVMRVGPAVVAKADPLGLLRREVPQTGVDELWVRPRVAFVNPVPLGFAKDLEGPTSDSSPAGDVSFHALRTYEPGDDQRHIHWLSTARTGSLMVRNYVDNRLPFVTILFDDRAGQQFEPAVEVAASLATSHSLRGLPVALFIGSQSTNAERLGTEQLLDRFCLVSPRQRPDGDTPLGDWVRAALASEPATSVLIIVTAAATVQELATVSKQIEGRAHPFLVLVGDQPLPTRIGGATTLGATDLACFAAAWNNRVRP